MQAGRKAKLLSFDDTGITMLLDQRYLPKVTVTPTHDSNKNFTCL